LLIRGPVFQFGNIQKKRKEKRQCAAIVKMRVFSYCRRAKFICGLASNEGKDRSE
jgi:hypothetical protein